MEQWLWIIINQFCAHLSPTEKWQHFRNTFQTLMYIWITWDLIKNEDDD